MVLIPVGWLGVRGWMAKGELEAAQAEISELKAKALAFDVDGAMASLDRVVTRVDSAVELTGDPVWRIAEGLPFLGKNLTAVRELAAATQTVMSDVTEPLVGAVGTLDPASLAPKDGAIDLAPLAEIVPVIASANTALEASLAEIAAIDTKDTLPQIVAAKEKVSTLLGTITPILGLANSVLPLVPPALGSEGPRNYAIMFQNSAEPRALGGTALSFVVLTLDQGRITLGPPLPAGSGIFPNFIPPLVSFPEGSQNIYPDSSIGTFIPNVTTRPSFVTAATVTQAMWQSVFGYSLDGIVSVDPIFLGYVLTAVDPIPLSSGELLSSDNLVPILLNEVYQRYNTGDQEADNIGQDALYGEVVSATFSKLMSGPLRFPQLIAAIQQGWAENRLLIWSARENEESALAGLGLPGELPLSDATTDRLGLYVQDYVGSKLGFYLQRTVNIGQAVCRPDGRATERATMQLTYAIDPAAVDGLSPSIVGQWKAEGVARGTQRLILMMYAPPGSEITAVSIDGVPVAPSGHYDAGYPVDLHIVEIAPGGTVTLSYDVVPLEPGLRAFAAQLTPMVSPTAVTTVPLDCATVTVP